MKYYIRKGLYLLMAILCVGWVQAQEESSRLSVGSEQKFNITTGSLIPVYANGHAVTITDAGEGKVKITADDDPNDYLVLDNGNEVIVFGGSRDNKITGNTSVKMISGTVNSIFGGGYGLTEATSADVTGTTNVIIEGGDVAIHVYSGSYGFGKIEKGVINISGENTKVRRLQAGGAAVGDGINLVEDYASAKNAVNNVTITINDATITEGMGTGGGFGYSYTGTSTVNVTNATLGGFYGTLSNGFANKITATLDGCTLKKLISYFEFATINRGAVKDATFTIKNCSFENLDAITAGVGPIEGWDDSDTNGNPTPYVKGDLVWKFENNKSDVPVMVFGPGLMEANITVDGAPVLMREFKQVKVSNVKEYTINKGKTWTFNNGLTIEDGVTLTKNGTLNIGVSSVEQLTASIAAGADKVTMATGEYALNAQLTLAKKIELVGATNENGTPATTLKRTAAWSGTDNSSKHMVCITAPEATVSNLIIDGNGLTSGMTSGLYEGSGIQVYQNNTNVSLSNITVKNMLAAGLVVNSAKVTLANFHTEGNLWGGVNVDKKASNDPALTVGNGCSFAEINKIWDESKRNAVSFTTMGKWTKTTLNNVDYWTNSWLSVGEKQAFNITSGQLTPVYANGHAVTISDAGKGKVKITADGDESDYLVLDNGSEVIVFGGSRDNKITGNTSVKMISGTVNSIFGGGYGQTVSADVTGTTNVTITGGNVAIHVYSGSYGFGKIENGVIKISGENTIVRRLQAGGAAVGSVELVDDYTLAKNAVKNVTITINDATITEGMGTGGGFGYSYTGTSTVNVTNATLGGFYGTLSNGFADNITATLDGCTLKKLISYFEFATINRGAVKDATFTIKNCSFENLDAITAGVGPIEGWDDSDTNGKPTPYVKGDLVWKFENNKTNVPVMVFGPGLMEANITVDGAPVLMREFKQVKVPNVKAYTINEGKTWTFNNGLELTSDVTLNNNGSLSVGGVCKVATDKQLETVLGEKATVSNIALATGSYNGFEVTKNDVTISGNKTATITGTVTVSGSDVTLKETKLAPASGKAVNVADNGSLTVSHNYWGENPGFATLIGGEGEVSPYPYYNKETMTEYDLVSQFIKVDEEREITEKIYPNCNLLVTSKGHAKLTQKNAKFYSVIIEEGGELTPPENNFNATGKVSVWNFVFKPSLKADKWKALGTQFVSRLIDNETGSDATLAEAGEDTGIWFATLKDNQTPAIEVTQNVPSDNVGLWAATAEKSYAFKATDISLVDWPNPNFSVDNGAKLQMCVNPNTHSFTTTETIYVLDAEKNVFVRREGATLAPFESYVIADDNTKATLRSIGTTDPNATGNEFVVKEGYYLTTERGAIVVHTAEPMELYVVAVSGAVVYRGTVADGERIAVPTGFYAVNGQMVRVK